MTIKNEMSKDTDDKSDIDSEKNESENKSPGYTGVKSSAKTTNEKKSGFFSSMLITILLALSVAIAIAYVYMPEKFNQYLSFNSTTDNSTAESTSEGDVSKDLANQDYIPAASAETYAMNNQAQQADRAAQQRADFEKRRAEFQKRNAEHYAQQWQPTAPPEPPQWVKDRQIEMEKQRAQYMQAMSEQQARWENNNRMNQMRMNPYQQNGANNQPYYAQQPAMQYPQNQPYNPNNQPPQQQQPQPQQQYYYPAPVYNYGPYNPPYGWQGNGYR